MGLWSCRFCLLQLIFILTSFEGALTITCKTFYSSNSSLFYYEYCSVGCCGSERSRKCCSADNTGAIVGGVVGALVFFLIVSVVMFICWQSNKKTKQLVDVEPEIDEFGYELEVMGDMHPYQTGSEPFNSPVSPSHLQGDFRHGDVDAETFPKHHGCPPPEYEENLPPMSPPPTYKEREDTVMSEERY